ncbi:hypothetical protein EVC27_065 [Rhizobium phage RHph_I1_6]|uniref:Uncharacterized protein n=1 Tax=Rhizobium phage RHph_I1_6 TaxID=2509728 RepID=A0A7S5UZL2_9CAUD|nr:hypothetical protein PP745_gp065 [Rhizobium phage RHph_I1_6]QIG76590.1 hypothetical protein EVC27_065 [Rhizobium phage RHph_I1_6]
MNQEENIVERGKPALVTLLTGAIQAIEQLEKKSPETTLALRSVEVARFWLQEDIRKNESN